MSKPKRIAVTLPSAVYRALQTEARKHGMSESGFANMLISNGLLRQSDNSDNYEARKAMLAKMEEKP